MSYSFSPASASSAGTVLGTPAPSMSLTEPVSGKVGGTVTVNQVSEGTGDLTSYEIMSVTCDNISEMCNSGSDLTIVIAANKKSFTFQSGFVDMFERVYKYTKAYDELQASWKGVNMIGAKFTTNGTTTVDVTIDNSLPVRVGDTITITGGLTASQKTMKGTWPITRVGYQSAFPAEGEAFTTFTIKLNKPTSANTTLTDSYVTYHTANRARYIIPGLDNKVKVDSFNSIYEFRYPPEQRLITFSVRLKVTGGWGGGVYTPGGISYADVKWAFKYLSNYNQTMAFLDTSISRGEEAIAAAAASGKVSPQGYLSLDDSVITSTSISISLNSTPIYSG